MINYFTFLLSLLSIISCNHSTLEDKISSLVEDKSLKLGISIYNFETKEQFVINGNSSFPMQSVYKFPIAMVVTKQVQQGYYSLTDTIHITQSALHPNTHSPIRDSFPNGTKMSLEKLIRYTMILSDNNGCDLLIYKAGGTTEIETSLKQKNIHNIHIKDLEKDIQTDWTKQFRNNTTPNAMINCLKKFYTQEYIQGEYFDFLWQAMQDTYSGSIRTYLPTTTKIGYKTGYSGVGPNNTIAALNCVGIMENQQSHPLAFAIFITDSKESLNTNLDLIAKIGQLIYND